jgi:uncharacterized membrane protein (UPF0127 family)
VRRLLLLSVFAFACGAAPEASPPPARTPTAAAVSGPRVVLPSGSTYSLEIARTPEDQARGLMFRESLPQHFGMLFPFPDNGVHGFWMKNTMIPLDILWLDGSGKVLFISADTPPCKADPCPSYGPNAPAASVLEIAGGTARREGIEVGKTLRFLDVR